MNYKKLLKNTVLGISTIVNANNTIFAMSLEEFLQTPQGQEVRQMVKQRHLEAARDLLLRAGFKNPDLEIRNLLTKLDKYSKQIVAQYINGTTLYDLMVSNPSNKFIADVMRKNPDSITNENKALYSQINTQQIFKEEDLILDAKSKVVIYQIQYEVYATDIFDMIERLYKNNPKTQSIAFKNITFEDTKDLKKVFKYLRKHKYDVFFGTINLFFDEIEDAEKALQIIQSAKEKDSFLRFKKIVFHSAIPFTAYAKLKQNPMCRFAEVVIDLDENDRKKILKQIEELETNPQVESITFNNENDDFFINLLASSAYKSKQADCVHSQEHASFKNFFCTLSLLWKEATFYSMETENFYGVDLKDFEYCSTLNTNDDVFQNSNIANLYLPFFEYDIDSLFSLFTTLDCIDFQKHGQTIWLPPYYANINLEESMKCCMKRLSEEDDESEKGYKYVTFNIRSIMNKVRFYTQEQITAIQNQHMEFYNFVKRNFLEKYMQYINFDKRPEWLTQNEWDNCVLPVKAKAEKLMAVMRCEKLPEEKSHNSNGMHEAIAAAMELSEKNERLITNELATRGLRIQDVTGDGNCGIYALLAGLNPNEAYTYNIVLMDSPAWQHAANLRQTLFGNANALGQMVNGYNQLDRWLALDNNEALQAVNAYVRNQGRSSLVILDTTVTAESEVAFTVINEHGESNLYNTLNDALNAAGNNPLILVYTPNHWKAVVPSNK